MQGHARGASVATRVLALVLFRIARNGGRPATSAQLEQDFAAEGIPAAEAEAALAQLEREGKLVRAGGGWAEKVRKAPPRPGFRIE